MTSAGGMLPRDGFHAKKLYDDKLKKSTYNRLIRPVCNDSDSLPVRVGLRLTSIIDVVRTARFFLHSLAFRNIGDAKAIWAENSSQILHFLILCKLGKGLEKRLSQFSSST